MTITSKLEFDQASSKLCGSMVSLDYYTRIKAVKEATELLTAMPKFLNNDPNCSQEIKAIQNFIAKVEELDD